MRVLCIDASKIYLEAPAIKEGNQYTVDGQPENDYTNEYYCLSEIPYICSNGFRFGYRKTRFVPISDIDETEMDRYKQPDKNKITIIREWVSEIDTDKIIQQS